jgi:hypothetical protein
MVNCTGWLELGVALGCRACQCQEQARAGLGLLQHLDSCNGSWQMGILAVWVCW